MSVIVTGSVATVSKKTSSATYENLRQETDSSATIYPPGKWTSFTVDFFKE